MLSSIIQTIDYILIKIWFISIAFNFQIWPTSLSSLHTHIMVLQQQEESKFFPLTWLALLLRIFRKWYSRNALQLLTAFLRTFCLGTFPMGIQLPCFEKPSNIERPHTKIEAEGRQQLYLSLWPIIISCLPCEWAMWMISSVKLPCDCSHVTHQLRTSLLILDSSQYYKRW